MADVLVQAIDSDPSKEEAVLKPIRHSLESCLAAPTVADASDAVPVKGDGLVRPRLTLFANDPIKFAAICCCWKRPTISCSAKAYFKPDVWH